MITQVDACIGEILQALEQSGQADNTIIVYTADDHGEMWGEHGLWGKQVLFDESAAVPLIVSAPALGLRSGVDVNTPVPHLDLYPALQAWCGIEQRHKKPVPSALCSAEKRSRAAVIT
jgi:arylsulfatase A-like enzyme